jgi:hypothetical protein
VGNLGDYIERKAQDFERERGRIKESDWRTGEDLRRLFEWAEELPEGAHRQRARELVGQVMALEENLAAGEGLPQADLLLAEKDGHIVGAGWADLEWGGRVYCVNQLVSNGGAGAALMRGFALKALAWGAEMRVEAALEGGSDLFYARLGAGDYVETNFEMAWHGPIAREGDPYAPVWDPNEAPTRAMAWSREALSELAGVEVAGVELT